MKIYVTRLLKHSMKLIEFDKASLAIISIALGLTGCGSSGDSPISPPAQAVGVTISAPLISPEVTAVEGAFEGDKQGGFTEVAERRVRLHMSAEQVALVHADLRPSADVGAGRTFLTLLPNSGWTTGTLGSSISIQQVFSTSTGINYAGLTSLNVLQSFELRHNQLTAAVDLFAGNGSNAVVGRAANNELFAAKLSFNGTSYQFEERRTLNGVWSDAVRSDVVLPPEFTPVRESGGLTYRLGSLNLLDAFSGAAGDAVVVNIRGSIDPPASFPNNAFGGNYFLWRDRGSVQFRSIGFSPNCPPLPPSCGGGIVNTSFYNARIESSGDLTFFSENFDASSGPRGSRWVRAGTELQTLHTEPYRDQTVRLLNSNDRAGFEIARDGTRRMWSTLNNETTINEAATNANFAPVPWTAASGERAACVANMRCRLFRANSADRLAYIAWDKPARRATLYVSDRSPDAGWKNVAVRDVSELVADLTDTGGVELASFVSAGASDLILGVVRNARFERRNKVFSMSVSARSAN
jgi:hypothetical protein